MAGLTGSGVYACVGVYFCGWIDRKLSILIHVLAGLTGNGVYVCVGVSEYTYMRRCIFVCMCSQAYIVTHIT